MDLVTLKEKILDLTLVYVDEHLGKSNKAQSNLKSDILFLQSIHDSIVERSELIYNND